MADYRFYCMDKDGRINLADWIEAATDEDAIRQARTIKPDAIKCEVWLLDRLVVKLGQEPASS